MRANFKLGFRNRSAHEQLQIGERTVINTANLSEKQCNKGQYRSAQTSTTRVRDRINRIASLESELRAERTGLKADLRAMRQEVTHLAMSVVGNVGFEPLELTKAGLELQRAKAPVPEPEAPLGLRAEPFGEDGIRVRWNRALRRDVYQVQMQRGETADEKAWKNCEVAVRTSCLAKDLESGAKYWFRIAAINTRGQGPWSQVVSVRVR
jgi:hypothetical protein